MKLYEADSLYNFIYATNAIIFINTELKTLL